jgi:hypothetical protein
MPSSLIIVALVAAWLLVLVPIVARRRQEVARTADSTLAARVVRSGGVQSTVEREPTMSDTAPGHTDDVDDRLDEELDEDFAEDELEDFDDDEYDADEYEDDPAYDDEYGDYEPVAGPARPFRRGRGGFDAEAAAMTARARYTFRQRVVVLMLLAAVLAGVLAVTVSPLLWWVHAIIDLSLVGYLAYLRRQVRIEEEIRERRAARLTQQRRAAARPRPARQEVADEPVEERSEEPVLPQRRPLTRHVHPGTVVVDTDDEDPAFAELDEPGALPYRRAVGE